MSRNHGKSETSGNSWIFGAALILAGCLFLFKDRLFFDLSISMLWPLFMLIPVIMIIRDLMRDFSSNARSIIPLTILSFLMCYFLWLNVYGWEHTATTWPNFVLAPGLGLLIFSFISKRRETLIPAFILIILTAVFYAAIIKSTRFAAIIMIASGTLLLIMNIFRSKNGEDNND